jgi:DNA-binding NarL/FixJ family response regulator
MTTSLRIVIADDEPRMRDYLWQSLERLGHHVVAAARTGRELIEQCRTHQPDLIISDIKGCPRSTVTSRCWAASSGWSRNSRKAIERVT